MKSLSYKFDFHTFNVYKDDQTRLSSLKMAFSVLQITIIVF